MAKVFAVSAHFSTQQSVRSSACLIASPASMKKHEMRWTITPSHAAVQPASHAAAYLLSARSIAPWWTPAEVCRRAARRSAFNTRVVYTNTNWQKLLGESTMSYLTQNGWPCYHNFVSAAVGSRSPSP